MQVVTKEGVFVRFIGEATSGNGKLDHPFDVAVDEQHIFVSSAVGKCIKVFTKEAGEFVREVRRAAADDMSELKPNFLTVSDGLLYAADLNNQEVAVFEG